MYTVIRKIIIITLLFALVFSMFPILPASASNDDDLYLGRDKPAYRYSMNGASEHEYPRTPFSISGTSYTVGLISGTIYSYAYFSLGGLYTTLSGVFGEVDGVTGGNCTTTITGDGRVLAVLYADSGDAAQEFIIDITGVSDLRIEMDLTSPGSLSSSIFAIANPLLSKNSGGYNSSSLLGNSRYPYLRVFDNKCIIDEPNVIPISTAEELASIGGFKSEGKYYVMTNDITLAETWKPIEDFRGTLDGAGYTVRNINILVSENGQGAGLFGTISQGSVTIKNLGVLTSGRGSISASVKLDNTNIARASTISLYSGGLIGRCTGGSVTIENCYFNGSISTNTKQFSVIKGVISVLTGPFTSVFGFDADLLTKLFGYFTNAQIGEKSYSYSGGLIGSIEGNTSVTIQDSYTHGRVYAYAETTASAINTNAYSYAGGLIGCISPQSMLAIGNCYSTANITADVLWTGILNSIILQNRYAGGLIGSGNLSSSTGNNYRLSTQVISGSREYINSIGIPLPHTAMQDSSSFDGWDFSNTWIVNTGEIEEPFSTFIESSFGMRGTDEDLIFIIDKDVSLFSDASVNDNLLTQNIMYTVENGSTKITLLPRLLDSLDSGFHTFKATFTDGIVVEEHFYIAESSETELPHVTTLYIDDVIVYSNGEVLVDEDLFNMFDDETIEMKAVFSNGSSHEEIITLTLDALSYDDLSNIEITVNEIAERQENSRTVLFIIIVVITVLLVAIIFICIAKKKKAKP